MKVEHTHAYICGWPPVPFICGWPLLCTFSNQGWTRAWLAVRRALGSLTSNLLIRFLCHNKRSVRHMWWTHECMRYTYRWCADSMGGRLPSTEHKMASVCATSSLSPRTIPPCGHDFSEREIYGLKRLSQGTDGSVLECSSRLASVVCRWFFSWGTKPYMHASICFWSARLFCDKV